MPLPPSYEPTWYHNGDRRSDGVYMICSNRTSNSFPSNADYELDEGEVVYGILLR